MYNAILCTTPNLKTKYYLEKKERNQNKKIRKERNPPSHLYHTDPQTPPSPSPTPSTRPPHYHHHQQSPLRPTESKIKDLKASQGKIANIHLNSLPRLPIQINKRLALIQPTHNLAPRTSYNAEDICFGGRGLDAGGEDAAVFGERGGQEGGAEAEGVACCFCVSEVRRKNEGRDRGRGGEGDR